MIIRQHAIVRLSERCKLTPEEVKSMLQNDKYHPIGIDDKRQHQHQLIYSEKDDDCFVIVQDEEDKDVITVLPINYHNAWIIHQDALDLAKKAYYGDKYVETTPKELSPKEQSYLYKLNKVKTINIDAYRFIIEERYLAYKKMTLSSKKSETIKVCTINNTDFVQIGFPKDVLIKKKAILKEYQDNIVFAIALNKFIRKNMEEQAIDHSNIYKYSLSLMETREQLSIDPLIATEVFK